MAAQSGLKVSETSLLVKMRQVRPSLANLTDIEFLSPYCIADRLVSKKSVLRIQIKWNPDPAFFLNPDPDLWRPLKTV